MMISPSEAPEALRRWADSSVVGRRRSNGKKRIAGWTWDGVSDHIDLLLAPKGKGEEPIPPGVWKRMHAPALDGGRADGGTPGC